MQGGVILYEDHGWRQFLPLVYWRGVCHLHCGPGTLSSQIPRRTGRDVAGLWVRPQLAEISAQRQGCPANRRAEPGTLLINARFIPASIPETLSCPGVGLLGNEVVLVHCDGRLADAVGPEVVADPAALRSVLRGVPEVQVKGGCLFDHAWDLMLQNDNLLRECWTPGGGRIEGHVHPGAHILNQDKVHIGRDSAVRAGAVIDADNGPVHIGARVTVQSNAVIEGPTHIGDDAVVNACARIRPGVSVGRGCRVGGELSASIIMPWTNKQHDGFVGHSYLGSWVNLGAGTTTSNLKNTYGEISVTLAGRTVRTGQTFLGSLIGDFCKTGIQQGLTTGCVIGFGTCLATSRIGPRFVPSFRFITDGKDEAYDVRRCLEVAARTMARRRQVLTTAEQTLFEQLPAVAEACESL